MFLTKLHQGYPLSMILFTIALSTSLVLLFQFFRKSQKSQSRFPWSLLPLPDVDEIVALYVYPIKSCRGFSVKSTRLLPTGLELDRNWMFVSADTGEFITIRTNSNMTLIRTAYDEDTDELSVSIRDEKKFVIPAHPTPEWLRDHTELKKAGIWGQQTDAWEYPATLTQPISDFLKSDVRLVYKGPTPRVLRGCGAPELLGRTESVKFADMMPVLIASTKSIAELNSRLTQAGEDEIDIERFRPNIVIRGGDPWAEDSWKTVRIRGEQGPLELDVVCRCLRCQVPNVDPDTAEKNPRQPWNKLVSYRRIDPGLRHKPSFGMLCVPKATGLVSVGMKFDVKASTQDHFFINPMK
ncbi:MOSC-domain-containing protein [Sarocladium strictum]